jgi:hypothetical protein
MSIDGPTVPVDSLSCCKSDTSLCYISSPYPSTPFGIEKKWESEAESILFNGATPMLVDIDNDCIPELITSTYSEFIFIDIDNGITKFSFPTINQHFIGCFVLGDIDNDAIPEIFIISSNSNSVLEDQRGKLICYNINGDIRWISNEVVLNDINDHTSGFPGLADFNQDGKSEIYIDNQIFNAETGVKLVDGQSNGLGKQILTSSIAAQLDNDLNDLELVAGFTFYKVEISNLDGILGNSMTPFNTSIDGKFRDGFTLIGDINNDEQLDVIVTSCEEDDCILYSYTWNSNSQNIENLGYIDIEEHDLSVPVIGQLHNTSQKELIISSPHYLYCFSYSSNLGFHELWRISIQDDSSVDNFGSPAASIFDLDNNGVKEIIFRDASDLIIYNSISEQPIEIARISCSSWTLLERPIVGGSDDNQNSQLYVSCGSNNRSKLFAFGSPDSLQPWAPSRNVWNQYNYHVLNINDDLSIPRVQENNATFLNGRYNHFGVQASLLDEDGNYEQPAASLVGELGCIDLDLESGSYTAHFELTNLEEASMDAPSGIAVSFYDGNPEVSGNLLGTYFTTDGIARGNTLTNLSYSFSAAVLTELFMVVNTSSNNNSTFNEDDFEILECSYFDNVIPVLICQRWKKS